MIRRRGLAVAAAALAAAAVGASASAWRMTHRAAVPDAVPRAALAWLREERVHGRVDGAVAVRTTPFAYLRLRAGGRPDPQLLGLYGGRRLYLVRVEGRLRRPLWILHGNRSLTLDGLRTEDAVEMIVDRRGRVLDGTWEPTTHIDRLGRLRVLDLPRRV